jgi:PiT family inorganic phosphate transporter
VAAVAALIAHIGPIGIVIDAVLGFGFILFIFWRSKRNKVDHSNAIPVPDVAESGYAVRIRKGKVKPLKTKTGTIPPLTPVAQSAVRDDIAAREAVKAAREAEVSELAGKVDDAERGSAR